MDVLKMNDDEDEDDDDDDDDECVIAKKISSLFWIAKKISSLFWINSIMNESLNNLNV